MMKVPKRAKENDINNGHGDCRDIKCNEIQQMILKGMELSEHTFQPFLGSSQEVELRRMGTSFLRYITRSLETYRNTFMVGKTAKNGGRKRRAANCEFGVQESGVGLITIQKTFTYVCWIL